MERKDMYGDELEFSVINDGNFPARTAVARKVTVVILRRLAPNAEERRAYIYVESPAMEELAMIIAARDLVLTVSYDAEGKCFDLSAGNYVSVDKEERDVYDANFVRRVEQSAITSY